MPELFSAVHTHRMTPTDWLGVRRATHRLPDVHSHPVRRSAHVTDDCHCPVIRQSDAAGAVGWRHAAAAGTGAFAWEAVCKEGGG